MQQRKSYLKQAIRVVLNDYWSSYRTLLDKISMPTLNVSTLKATAIEAYKCKANTILSTSICRGILSLIYIT